MANLNVEPSGKWGVTERLGDGQGKNVVVANRGDKDMITVAKAPVASTERHFRPRYGPIRKITSKNAADGKCEDEGVGAASRGAARTRVVVNTLSAELRTDVVLRVVVLVVLRAYSGRLVKACLPCAYILSQCRRKYDFQADVAQIRSSMS